MFRQLSWSVSLQLTVAGIFGSFFVYKNLCAKKENTSTGNLVYQITIRYFIYFKTYFWYETTQTICFQDLKNFDKKNSIDTWNLKCQISRIPLRSFYKSFKILNNFLHLWKIICYTFFIRTNFIRNEAEISQKIRTNLERFKAGECKDKKKRKIINYISSKHVRKE